MKRLSILAICSIAASVFAADIHMAGDSTMASYDAKRGMAGWGQVLPELCAEGVTVHNHARSGYSISQFRRKKLWAGLLKNVKPGDFVIIQFGHNDQKLADDPNIGPEKSMEIYKSSLQSCIDDVKAKQANPIVVTSIIRVTYGDADRLEDTANLRLYCESAMETAKTKEVPVVDLNQISREKITEMGRKAGERLYRVSKNGKDRTHLIKTGADAYAAWFVEAVKTENLPIAECFK